MQGDSPGCSGGFLCGFTITEIGSETRKNREDEYEGTQHAKQRFVLPFRTVALPKPSMGMQQLRECAPSIGLLGDVWLNSEVVIKQIM